MRDGSHADSAQHDTRQAGHVRKLSMRRSVDRMLCTVSGAPVSAACAAICH
jgi:hypothetical protein